MDADEALQGITRHARADIRKLFKDGKLLPIDQWPDDMVTALKAVKPKSIVFHDRLRALELMAIAGGELKNQHEHKHTFDHAAYLGAEPPADDDE